MLSSLAEYSMFMQWQIKIDNASVEARLLLWPVPLVVIVLQIFNLLQDFQRYILYYKKHGPSGSALKKTLAPAEIVNWSKYLLLLENNAAYTCRKST